MKQGSIACRRRRCALRRRHLGEVGSRAARLRSFGDGTRNEKRPRSASGFAAGAPRAQSCLRCVERRSARLKAAAIPEAAATAAAAFASLIAVPAKHRPVATRFKRDSRGLATTRTNHGCTLRRSGTVTGATTTLIVLLRLPAGLATLRRGITALLKERLIRRCERKVLPAIAACKLNISGHGCPRGDCTAQSSICVKSYKNRRKFLIKKCLCGFTAISIRCGRFERT